MKKNSLQFLIIPIIFILTLLPTSFNTLRAATVGDVCSTRTDCNTGDCAGTRECYCPNVARRCARTNDAGQYCFEGEECFSGICKIDPLFRADVCGCLSDEDCEYEDQQCMDHLCTWVRDKWGGQTCSDNAECSSGECRSGVCTCTSNAECPISGQVCDGGRCLATTQTASCTSNDECTTGICVTSMHRCGCRSDTDCQEGSTCQGSICYVATGGEETPLEDISKLKRLPFETLPALVNFYIKGLLPFVGIWALIFFVFGGIIWLTSGGSPDKIKKAQQMMFWATVGIVFIFASYAIVSRIIPAVGG